MTKVNHIPAVVGKIGNQAVIRLSGACTAAICEQVQEFLAELSKPSTTDVYFDLSQTDWIDSTFAGLLVSLVARKVRPSTPDIHLLDVSGGAAQSLANIHVLRLFDIVEAAPATPTEWTELPNTPVDITQIGKLVIESHEALIQADERNAPTFQHVVELFRANQPHGDDIESSN